MIGIFEKQFEGEKSFDRKELAVATLACLVGTLMIARCAENKKLHKVIQRHQTKPCCGFYLPRIQER
jgi:hypothetical protein